MAHQVRGRGHQRSAGRRSRATRIRLRSSSPASSAPISRRDVAGAHAQHIDDYRESVGNTRAHAADVNHGQRGDPRKLASAFIALANAKNPPLRLPLGSDTVERIEAKNAFVAKELAEWRTLATSTDFRDKAA